nr:GNAT family N-acetyltransferase [Phenylobacterium glaciei]
MITTQRTILRPWRDEDLDAFADMLADPEVQADAGGPVDRDAAARKMARYRDAYDRLGFSRWVVIDHAGDF